MSQKKPARFGKQLNFDPSPARFVRKNLVGRQWITYLIAPQVVNRQSSEPCKSHLAATQHSEFHYSNTPLYSL
jgi:hypothetical protein